MASLQSSRNHLCFIMPSQVRITNSKQDVFSGHSKVFKKVIREISDKIERRELSAHHQRKRTELLLFHFYEPIIAAGAAVKLLLFYRAGARLFLLACRHAIKKTLRRPWLPDCVRAVQSLGGQGGRDSDALAGSLIRAARVCSRTSLEHGTRRPDTALVLLQYFEDRGVAQPNNKLPRAASRFGPRSRLVRINYDGHIVGIYMRRVAGIWLHVVKCACSFPR